MPRSPRSTSRQESGLSERDREILRDTIVSFTLTGEPVSSRSIAKLRGGTLSAATIRNVMADLEDMGYLSQPHASAGRVPTRAGYHLYIDSLMGSRGIEEGDRRHIDEILSAARPDAEHILESSSQLLSELTHQIGIVIAPTLGETTLKAMSFVNLSGRKVLCVLVSANGFVDNKLIETRTRLTREELIRISNYLTDHFAGLTLREIRDRLLTMMAEDRARVDRLLADAIDLAEQAFEESDPREVLVEGTVAVLDQPELNDLQTVRRLLDTFSDKAKLVRVLNGLIDGPGVRVVIGKDSHLTSDLNFSLVATTYGSGRRKTGTLGIFGPSRMEYSRIIPLVDYFGERLSEALELTFGEVEV